MPKYDYYCGDCAEEFELTENGEQRCPFCEALMARLWSPVAFSVDDGTGAYKQQRIDESSRQREVVEKRRAAR